MIILKCNSSTYKKIKKRKKGEIIILFFQKKYFVVHFDFRKINNNLYLFY